MADNSALNSLVERFRGRLRLEIREFAKLNQELEDPRTCCEIENRAHKLAGLAGSLGFHEISSIAKELDRPAEKLMRDMEATRQSLVRLVESMSEAANYSRSDRI